MANTTSKKNTVFVFTFGRPGVGKSTILAAITYFLKISTRIILRVNRQNKGGMKVVIEDWTKTLSRGNFPPRSIVGEIIEVDVGLEDGTEQFEELGFTFFEISGEDLMIIDLQNFLSKSGSEDWNLEETEFPETVIDAIRCSEFFIIVVQSDELEGDYDEDWLIDQFFEILEEEKNKGKLKENIYLLLIISKWDLSRYSNTEKVIKKYLSNTYAWIRSKRLFDKSAIKTFTIGEVKKDSDEKAVITDIKLDDARKIIEWIYKAKKLQ